MKKVVIAAGTGFLGQAIVNMIRSDVEEIVILTRGPKQTLGNVRHVHWDAERLTGWENELEAADLLINLAGKSVDCRYTEKNKREILASRINSTAVLNLAVRTCSDPPKHWLNAATATIYHHSEATQMDETSLKIGGDFSMDVAIAWEREFFGVDTPATLKTALRTSIVLGRFGGAFPALKNLTRLGFGGTQGNGKQFISWIHETDFVRALLFCVERQITGVVNIVSPKPSRNVDFMRSLRNAMQIRAGIPLGTKLLKAGAKIIGTETELVLKSRNVIPARLTEQGFTFVHAQLDEALSDLVTTN